MTTHDNTKAKLKAFDAFAPVADALEAIPNLDVPGVARDFAKRVTGLGEKFATDSRDAVEKARLPKKRLGGRDIALGVQPEVNRPPRPIHGTIEIVPFGHPTCSDGERTKRTLLGLNRVDRRSMRRSNCPGSQAAFRCRKLLYSAVSKSMYPPNDTGSPNGRICVAQKPPKPFLRSIQ